ncbi:heavy-metal-associated domain-containing protein [Streptomyces sp. NPDC058614]|uniref:heavy-metal-associated domain-containing protein n=1 Tax=Streptomyces sp. NPDC058614 TaxID=3346557 RepID=UPI003663692C
MKLFGGKNQKGGKEPEAGPQVILEIEGMHCSSCGMLIDDELEEVPGVRSARTDVRRGRSIVRLKDAASVDTDLLIKAVQVAGDYTARLAD